MTFDRENSGRFLGFVDASENGVINGWAVDLENIDKPTEVDVYVDGRRARTVVADLERSDLRDLFDGKFHYGFYCDFGGTGRLEACFGRTLEQIPTSTAPSQSLGASKISPRDSCNKATASRLRAGSLSMVVEIKLDVDETSICDTVTTLKELLSSDKHCRYRILERPITPHLGIVPIKCFGDADHAQRWRVPRPRLADLYLFKIKNAFVFPAFGVVLTEDGEALRHAMGEAAHKTPDLQLLNGAFHRNGRTAIKMPDHIRRFKNVSVTMPAGARTNYGHFLLDALPAAVTLRQHGLLNSHVMVTPKLKRWQQRHLDLLKLDPLELSDEVIWADEVIYTSAMNHYLHAPNLNYLDVVHQQRDQLLAASAKTAARIYLSRGKNRRRTLISEGLLIDRLLALDFQVLDAAVLTVDEQIACFNNADVVVGPTGAAFANVLYCRPGTRVVEIQPTGMESYWVQLLCGICGSKCLTYGCNSLSGDTRTQLTFDIDVQRFIDSLLRFMVEA